MKNSKPINNFQDLINAVLDSNKFKYIILLSIAYLISLTLTAQNITEDHLALHNTNNPEIKVAGNINQSLLQPLSVKIQINPPYNQNLSDYAGLTIDLLSANNEHITTGVLDKKGQTRFEVLTPLSLENVSVYCATTNDKLTIENPHGAVIGFLISALNTTKDI
ncbi:hypothetical protein QQ020_11050 [Fulvivirgaceae bacterium BMA12]|uniref:Uncharacterized protein n=1 Tax=Agaribacillus aureus TaxID=3051825 RepID=A0ABT8L4E6_9BACT|nr:hypothetical protein [Fulvivirgaceae bacterium BMA12]